MSHILKKGLPFAPVGIRPMGFDGVAEVPNGFGKTSLEVRFLDDNYQAKFLVSTHWIAGNETDKLIEKMVGHPVEINEEFDFDSLIGNQFQVTIKTINGLDRATDVSP